jgi:hypothetical protein
MKLDDMARRLSLQVVTPPPDPQREVVGGYASDLLSCVMARAKAGYIWVTLQSHPNVVAVASLLDLAGVIITEDAPIEAGAVQKASEEGVALYSTPLTTYTVVARLAAAGVPGNDP